MKKQYLAIITAIFLLGTTICIAQAEDDKASGKNNYAAGQEDTAGKTEEGEAAGNSQDEIKELERKQQEVKDKMQEETEDVQEAKNKLEEVQKEKESIEKEIKLKQEEAKVAKKELKIIKEKAVETENAMALKETEKIERESEEIEKEVVFQKKKLRITEEKEQLAEKMLNKEQSEIKELLKEIQELRAERAGRRSLFEKLVHSAEIILLGIVLFILLKFGFKGIEKLVAGKDEIRESEVELRIRTLSKLFNWLGGIIITIIILYMLLEIHGFNVAPLLASAGIIGLAFGFGGQYLIRDLINGLFILIEGQYRINDVVKIGDLGGLVEDINLRITTLRDLGGRVIIIPNGEIATVINYTRGYSQALLDIGVAYKENVDQIMDVIKEVGSEMRKDKYFGRLILDDLEMFGVDDYADSAVIIKFRIKTRPIKQWEVKREFRRRLKNRFDELGIEIPFPHITMYWGTGEDNNWMKEFANRKIDNNQE